MTDARTEAHKERDKKFGEFDVVDRDWGRSSSMASSTHAYPTPNAYELYQGLQDVGVPVKLIIYKGFNHGLNKPKAVRAAMEHNWEWFNQYVWGEKPVPTTASAR